MKNIIDRFFARNNSIICTMFLALQFLKKSNLKSSNDLHERKLQ